jgi:hypothetical protein
MGIRGLWNVSSISKFLASSLCLKSHLLQQAVSAASQKRTLTEIAVSEGFDQQRHQDRCLILGIDARCAVHFHNSATINTNTLISKYMDESGTKGHWERDRYASRREFGCSCPVLSSLPPLDPAHYPRLCLRWSGSTFQETRETSFERQGEEETSLAFDTISEIH